MSDSRRAEKRVEVSPTAEGIVRCSECGQTSVCHQGDFELYQRDGWPNCPVDGRRLQFIPRSELSDDPNIVLRRR